jgi:hypothetical protein
MMRTLQALAFAVIAMGVTPSLAEDIAISKVVFTQEADPGDAQDKAIATLTGLGPVVYVDWSIPYDIDEEQCEWEEGEDSAGFWFHAFGSFHYPVDIVAASAVDAPLNEVACQSPELLRIRGLYYVLQSDIPTAMKTELRPLPATVETIFDLAAAGAF